MEKVLFCNVKRTSLNNISKRKLYCWFWKNVVVNRKSYCVSSSSKTRSSFRTLASVPKAVVRTDFSSKISHVSGSYFITKCNRCLYDKLPWTNGHPSFYHHENLKNTSNFSVQTNQDRQHRPTSQTVSKVNFNLQSLHHDIRLLSSLLLQSRGNTFRIPDVLRAAGIRQFSTTCSRRQNQNRNEQDGDKEQDPQDEEKAPFVARLMLLFWVGFLLYVALKVQSGDDGGMYKFVSWNEFVHEMLAKGEVEEMIVRPEAELAFIRLHPGAIIKGRRMDSDIFTMKILDPYKFEDKVRKAEADLGIRPERGIPISYQRENNWAPLVVLLIIALAVFLMFKNLVKVQLPNPTDLFANVRKAKFTRVDLTQQGKGITFKDVAGLHEAKIEVMEFIDYLKKPDKFKELGARIPKGALLLGPPGCGKTLLAKAVATEAEVPFLAMAGSEFVEMLGGLGAARVRDLFKEARQRSPCIIYLDEIDAIGRNRGGDKMVEGQSEEEHTLNQLLVEMDGMSTTDGIIMLASTNRAEVLDKALLRPGRFDRHIQIDLPTLIERREMFEMYLKKLKLVQAPTTYSERLAQLSPGMSGADIANICNEAALHAARHNNTAIDSADFDYAVERVVAGVAKKSRVLTEQEKKVVAYHEAGHALMGWVLEHTDAPLRVSIVPRTSHALGFSQYLPSDKKLVSKGELFEKMCMALGGRVAESLSFNSVTTSGQDDLRKVTKMAYAQIRELGMNDKIGHVSFPMGDQKEFGTKPYSKRLQRVIDEEARLLVAHAYLKTEQVLTENKEKLRMIAEALLEKETLTYAEMEQLIGPPKFQKKDDTSVQWGAPQPGIPTEPQTQS